MLPRKARPDVERERYMCSRDGTSAVTVAPTTARTRQLGAFGRSPPSRRLVDSMSATSRLAGRRLILQDCVPVHGWEFLRGRRNGDAVDKVRLRRQAVVTLGLAVLIVGLWVAQSPAVAATWTTATVPMPGDLSTCDPDTPNCGLPNAGFDGVSCGAVDICEAVGRYEAVSTTKPYGDTIKPLAEAWNGHTWQLQMMTAPVPGATMAASNFQLAPLRLSCSGPRFCMAVGSYEIGNHQTINRVFAERWNGSRWAFLRLGTPGDYALGSHNLDIDGVSCTSSRLCLAVGFYTVRNLEAVIPLVQRWNGHRWRLLAATPRGLICGPRRCGRHQIQGAELWSISCLASNRCMAVGNSSAGNWNYPFAEFWDGRRWKLETPPTPRQASVSHGGTMLYSVSCTDSRACTAVGSYRTRTGATKFLAVRWNGNRWVRQRIATPASASHSAAGLDLDGVSCVIPRACIAVAGSPYGAGSASTRSDELIEAWNGLRWHWERAPAPSLARQSGGLSSVSCARVGSCVAVGSFYSQGALPYSEHTG